MARQVKLGPTDILINLQDTSFTGVTGLVMADETDAVFESLREHFGGRVRIKHLPSVLRSHRDYEKLLITVLEGNDIDAVGREVRTVAQTTLATIGHGRRHAAHARR